MVNTSHQQSSKSNSAQKRILRKKIRKLTFGITDTITNVILYFLYITISMPGKTGPAGVHRAFNQADEFLANFDAKQIRRALTNLKQQGLVHTIKKATTLPQITKAGLRRLADNFPSYDEKRIWDGNLYLITYDIPIKADTKRSLLRHYLVKLKAIKLQDSVYLTPYNPREIINRLVDEYNIPGQILVSTLDPRDTFGKTDLKKFLWGIYGLGEINDRYANFIEKYSRHRSRTLHGKKECLSVAFAYLSILQDDPQLPFELLPDSYLGDEAYLLFRKLISSR